MRAGTSIVDLIPYDPLLPGDEVFLASDPPPVPLFERNPPRPMIGTTMSDAAAVIPESIMPVGGVWMKTHFYQEGPVLKSTTTCVTCGDVEVMKFEVDMRPIAKAAVDYHNSLHARERSMRDRPGGLKSSVGFDDLDTEEIIGYDEVIAGCGWDPFCHLKTGAKKAVKTISKGARKIASKVKKIAHSKLLKKIGQGMKSLVKKVGSHLKTFSGFSLVKGLLKGERVDKALLKNFKAMAKDVKSNAGYAQMVVSVVPGIGTGVAAGIAGAAALAEGKRIDDVLIAATKGALPGGPLAAAAFDTAVGLAKGKRIDKIALELARNQLPEAGRRAFDTGVALAHGKALQGVLASGAGRGILPNFKMPRMSPRATQAYAASSKILSSLENGASTKSALRNVAKSRGFLKKIRSAMAKVGTKQAVKSLKRNRALAQKARSAMAVSQAAKSISKRSVQRALGNEKKALRSMARIVKAARSQNPHVADAAKKSLAVLKVVARERARVAAVAQANAGGTPGMYVNNRGELLRGNFARQVSSTAAKGAFYSRDGVESGHFMRMPSPQRQARSHPTPHLAQPRRANVQIPRRAQPSPVAMAKLAALARRARGGDRQAQAQIASLKRMAAARAHPGRVSGNAVNEAYESITSYRRQRSILDNALESVDTPTSDNEITALVGCPPTVGDNFDPREFFAAVEEVAPEKITNIVGAMGFPNIAHAVRRAQQGDPRARAAIQRVAHTVNQAKAQKMQRRAKLAKLCARLAGRVGASPLPEPPSEAAILFNGENFIGPPLVGCPPMPVGVNPLTVGLIESPLVGCPPLPRV